MPDHPMIRWETDGGALLPVDRNVRTRDPGYAGDPRYADTQRKNNVEASTSRIQKLAIVPAFARALPGARARSRGASNASRHA
jgi:hypothetical protein